jgi:hypothetical protein
MVAHGEHQRSWMVARVQKCESVVLPRACLSAVFNSRSKSEKTALTVDGIGGDVIPNQKRVKNRDILCSTSSSRTWNIGCSSTTNSGTPGCSGSGSTRLRIGGSSWHVCSVVLSIVNLASLVYISFCESCGKVHSELLIFQLFRRTF